MVYVGLPMDANREEIIREALMTVEKYGVDCLTRQRIESGDVIPGALWHVYQARDADRIRDFLNMIAIERGGRLIPRHDPIPCPIHDQSWYLDDYLRKRLYTKYGVSSYGIIQCLGDAIFIPAGAPYQVQNLFSCINVAEDFVSPEKFRQLSDAHTNREDKLQIKNITFHAVKNSVAVLARAKNVTHADLLNFYQSSSQENPVAN